MELEQKLGDWYAKAFHNTAVSQDTQVHNVLHAATQELKARLEKNEASEAPVEPSKLIDAWESEYLAGNSGLQRSGHDGVIAEALKSLRELFA